MAALLAQSGQGMMPFGFGAGGPEPQAPSAAGEGGLFCFGGAVRERFVSTYPFNTVCFTPETQ